MKYNPQDDGFMDNDLNSDDEIDVIEARHRTPAERRNMGKKQGRKQKKDIYDIMDLIKTFFVKYKQQIGVGVLTLFVVLLFAAGVKSCGKNGGEATPTDAGKKTTSEKSTKQPQESTQQTTAEPETEPQLSVEPENAESEIATLVSSFYNAYVISGDLNEVAKYVDSTNGMDSNRLAINKKYIESVSDFKCYKAPVESVDENFTVLLVTYKIKLYNYTELLPSIDILFLVEGDQGYRVRNLTVDDAFDKQKVESNSDFQILRNQVDTELQGLLAANPQLTEVYNLYLNPNAAGQ